MGENLHYLTFDEVGITVAVIGIALAFLVLTWNAVKAIHDWRKLAKKPTEDRIDDQDRRIDDHDKRISRLEECCTEVRGKLEHDWEFQQDETEMNRLMLKSIKQLIKHSLDGNDTNGLMAVEGEIDDYLIKHAN